MTTTYCTRCGERLKNEKGVVWLELNFRTGRYSDETVPPAESQGAFPFGSACAKTTVKESQS